MNVIEGKMTQDGIKVGIVGGKHRRSMGAGSIRDTTHRKEDGKKWKI